LTDPFQILIVDDNPKNLQILEEILSEQGYDVLLATNGLQAIRAAKGVCPDLILMDVMMPEMDGHEACRHLKELPETTAIPIIFLTAKTATEDIVQGFECGAVDYVSKPFNSIELLARVKTHLKLKSTLENLTSTQAHLVQSEKMAGLVTLVAGIAHEINNPLNFIYNGTQLAEKELQDFREYLFSFIDADSSAMVPEFEMRFKQIFSMLSTAQEGGERIEVLVKDLRVFSRLGEAKQKTIDLVESLRATLRFVQSLYVDKVEFVEDFQIHPKIECQPALLNQAFMNLILNACCAIENTRKQAGTLTIRTLRRADTLVIQFKDTGCGMSESTKKQIFDPFYTTKDVGQGTGLGLSITLGVLEKHHGEIEVESTEGVGSTFTILLPFDSKGLD
jgi:two-component system NtrC family sensor kinase